MINKNVKVPAFFFSHWSDNSFIFFNLHDSVIHIQTDLENRSKNQEAQWKTDVLKLFAKFLSGARWKYLLLSYISIYLLAYTLNFIKNKFFHTFVLMILLKFWIISYNCFQTFRIINFAKSLKVGGKSTERCTKNILSTFRTSVVARLHE